MTENKVKFHIPHWEELPDIELYSDQVIKYLEDYLEPFHTDKTEKVITNTMINNYVKQGVIKPPVKKKYNKSHLAYLFVICLLKQVYSIHDIKVLIRLALGVVPVEISYNRFCITLKEAITCIFENKEYVDEEELGKGRRLLKCAILSYANKLYVEKTFLNK
ncbi:MAG: DUF1836 domain-containing protein [Oscillospiraceae bacterium]|nr:DUF1836 domain-containing protein [Oscillospiraceae bacterium]